MGSVKDLIVLEPAYENRAGLGNFIFSDRYSVFDWGEMPDLIIAKGQALALMAAYHFEALEEEGIRTHYQGLVSPRGGLVRFADLKEDSLLPQTMQVSLARVYRPLVREFWVEGGAPELRCDYSFFEMNRGRVNNYLIGLEVIFRNGLPLGSSVFKEIGAAKAIKEPSRRRRALKAVLNRLGLEKEPEPGTMLPRPVMSFTTKLESGDRGLSEEEAFAISGLKEQEFLRLKKLAQKANKLVTRLAEKAGFLHYDGKVEMIYDRGLALCDVVGTFDENRFAIQGEQISKEVLRQWYKASQPEFVSACEEWKKIGTGWQKRCAVKPRRLPPELMLLVSQMYRAGCNRYTGKRLFRVPELEAVLQKLSEYRS